MKTTTMLSTLTLLLLTSSMTFCSQQPNGWDSFDKTPKRTHKKQEALYVQSERYTGIHTTTGNGASEIAQAKFNKQSQQAQDRNKVRQIQK